MLCIGSSLEVYPVAQLPETTLSNGGQIAIVTRSRTPLDRQAAVRMNGDVVDELGAVLAALGQTRDFVIDGSDGVQPLVGSRTYSVADPWLSRKRRRPRPERRLDPSERERDRFSLRRAGTARERCRRSCGHAVAQPAQLLDTFGQRGRRRVARQLGERGVERDQHLQRGLARASRRRGRAARAVQALRKRAADGAR